MAASLSTSAFPTISAADGPVLIVEDDFFIGQELVHAFKASGARIAGAATDIETAFRIIETQPVGLAVLDINLGGDMVFPVASKLRRTAVPIVFASGFTSTPLPDEFSDVPVFEKPFNAPEIVRALIKGPITQRQSRRFANGVLSRLPQGCADELRRHVSLAPLRPREALQRAGARLEHVWFIESGLCVLSSRPGCVETAMIGREGVVGAEAIAGTRRAAMHCVVLAAGQAVRIGAQALRELTIKSPQMRDILLRYLQALHVQTASTLESASLSGIRARIARWLLMSADRIGPDLPITHETLSELIGVRRAGVTEALQELQAAGAIERRRGRVALTDRALLEAEAGAYGEAERAYARLVSE